MESMKRVASKSAKRSVSNPDAADEDEQEVLEKPKAKPKIKVSKDKGASKVKGGTDVLALKHESRILRHCWDVLKDCPVCERQLSSYSVLKY